MERPTEQEEEQPVPRLRLASVAWALVGASVGAAVAALALLETLACGAPCDGGAFHVIEGLVALAGVLGLLGALLLQRRHAGMRRVMEALRRQGNRDSVTGLYGRRYLERTLEMEVARAGSSGRPLALLMVDLDNFKDVNDRLGHRVGDGVLGEVGRVLQRCARSTDLAARYGGDEFALLLPGTDRQGAVALARRLETAVQALEVPVGDDGGSSMRVGLSWGVAQFPEDGATASALLLSADRALYQAKRQRSG